MCLRTKIGELHSELLHIYEIIRFKIDPRIRAFVQNLKIANSNNTIDAIINNHSSIVRFGDGEFFIIEGGFNNFQESNKKLQRRLVEVLTQPIDNVLIGLPYAWIDSSHLSHGAKVFFVRYVINHYKILSKNIDFKRNYYDSLFTRFYIDYQDKSGCQQQIEKIKRIWCGRNVFLIEGKLTRMGVGNDLFDNVKSLKRILGPSKNAFDKYNDIFKMVTQLAPLDSLLLIAMGMTATVLAYDLAILGYQVIDIGHIDVEYEWMKRRAKKKIALENRFVNEANNFSQVIDCKDHTYIKQIIATID